MAIAKREFQVHTQRFAFRALEEDDESVKMSNATRGRSSAHCAQNRQFRFNTNEPLPNFATRTKQTTSLFPFAADKRVSRTSNLAIHAKQITSSQITTLFLFDTNERSRLTTHQSLITNATGAFNDFHIRSAHGSMAAESLATKFNSSGKGKA